MDPSSIVGAIIVTHETPHGILAKVDGQTQLFPNRKALFRTAVELLDVRIRDRRKKEGSDDTATSAVGRPGRQRRAQNNLCQA